MPNKGIDLNALIGTYGDTLVIYNGGVFCGHTTGFTTKNEKEVPREIELTIKTYDYLALDPRSSTSDIAIGVLRKLLKKSVEHEDKESEELISGALTLLEL